MITLRPYQDLARQQLRDALATHRAVLYCLPCGGGKGTLVAAMIHGAVKRGKHVVFAVHGRALVHDLSERVTKLGVEHGVLMGGKKRERWHSVQIASVDTLHRMEQKPPADLIVLDEARTFLSDTGRTVIDEYPAGTKIVGLDATPERLDGKGLGAVAGGIFDVMVMGPNEQDLIDMGYLVPSIPIGIPDPPDLAGVKKSGGDFNQKDLAAACDKVKLVGNIVEHWLREARGLKTVAFGVDKAHALHIAQQFQAAGIEWEYVDSDTVDGAIDTPGTRANIWHRLDHGTLMGVSNCGVCTVGWDHPAVACLIAARPTASRSLWRQMLGRGSRIHPGKKFFKVLDHAGNAMRHWPYGFFETPPVWTLDGKPTTKGDEKAPAVATCKVPVLVPPSGVPESFTGPVSSDGKYMLGSYHTFRAGPSECPYCGLPLGRDSRVVEVEDGNLVDLAALRETAKEEVAKSAKQLEHEARMKLRYLELVRIGRKLTKKDGTPYSPKWPTIAFKIEFGRFPKPAWKAEANG